ncbi:MAG TPA: hypothetical protein VFU40_07575 [Gemmatimonadales bacterium]|nr:hypothetical protein [Gemmatimonadales bacterium]
MSRTLAAFLSLVFAACLPGILSAQAGQPTVGDTVWLIRTVAVPAGYAVRAAEWDPAEPIEVLGRARVTATGDSAQVAYPVVAWRPGQHQVELPGPLLLGPGGTVDSLRGERVRLDIASVLPPGAADSALAPQPRAALVARDEATFSPLVILWGIALAFLLPVHFWWRRRGKPTRAQAPAIPPDALEPPLGRWAEAGESRAVAGISASRLRAALAERLPAAHPGLDTERVLAEIAAARPAWPLEEMAELLRALDDARFGSAPAADALGLAHSTNEMRERLLRAAA